MVHSSLFVDNRQQTSDIRHQTSDFRLLTSDNRHQGVPNGHRFTKRRKQGFFVISGRFSHKKARNDKIIDDFSVFSACTCERQGNAGTGVFSVAIFFRALVALWL